MNPREILDLEVSLLLLKHGRHALLQAIARRMQLSDDALKLELERLLRLEFSTVSRKKGPPKPFVLDTVLVGHGEKAEYLRQLHTRFENRTFLAELKDVRRLFDRHRRVIPRWKSRTNAEASVFRFLANLDVAELKKILADVSAGPDVSSLGIISDEILGRNKTRT